MPHTYFPLAFGFDAGVQKTSPYKSIMRYLYQAFLLDIRIKNPKKKLSKLKGKKPQ